jgi:hypothetical protein
MDSTIDVGICGICHAPYAGNAKPRWLFSPQGELIGAAHVTHEHRARLPSGRFTCMWVGLDTAEEAIAYVKRYILPAQT